MTACPDCGNTAPAPDGFCSSCGNLIAWSADPPARPGRPPGIVWTAPAAAAPPTGAPHPAAPDRSPSSAADAETLMLDLRRLPQAGRHPDTEATRPAPRRAEQPPDQTGLFCQRCGVRNRPGASFCRHCGQVMTAPAAPPPNRVRWWRRLLGVSSARPARAGDRPVNFRPGPPAPAHRNRHVHLRSRLPLSRLLPVLLVLSLLGLGIGPGREWLTRQVSSWVGDVRAHVKDTATPVTPVGAAASTATTGYGAPNLIDGNSATSWASDPHAAAVGQLVTITFAAPTEVDRISLLSGLPGAQYVIDGRIRTVDLVADGSPAGSLSFLDSAQKQDRTVTLPHVHTLTVRITAVYPGQQQGGVAVRELEFNGLR